MAPSKQNTAARRAIPTINIELGGEVYAVAPLPIRPAQAWRGHIAGALMDMGDLFSGIKSFDIENGADLMAVLEQLKPLFVQYTEIVLDALCSYAPAVAADRERIENEAYDPELVEAFLEVCKLAFPLDRLQKAFQAGRSARTTSTNSPRPNTELHLMPKATPK